MTHTLSEEMGGVQDESDNNDSYNSSQESCLEEEIEEDSGIMHGRREHEEGEEDEDEEEGEQMKALKPLPDMFLAVNGQAIS